MKTVLDFRSAREKSTLPMCSPEVVRAYIDDRVFISRKGQYNFDSEFDATCAILNDSEYGDILEEHAQCCTEFFEKDEDWKEEFELKVWANLLKDGFVKFKTVRFDEE